MVREYIAAGDIFQAVISRSVQVPCSSAPLDLYRALRDLNPSPYMYYLDYGDMQVIGASPEMLVRVENRKVTTVPIAGTRPRGRTPDEDAQFARELLADEKERAEHTMLVDLARNDVGRVARYGSVTVENFMTVEQYSHVQHIVSTVSGVLRDNLDCFDAFRSCFPAGTVTGAPKIRAMEIIRTLEGSPRGVYAGAVGYAGFNRNLEFAIAIRTIVMQGGTATIRSGAGIVADSIPELEVEETRRKAEAMLAAIERVGGAQ
jgi:anthranilate synthase component 1